MKLFKKMMKIVLSLAMVFTMLTVSSTPVDAADMITIEKRQNVTLNDDTFIRVYHVDAGRKYFTVEQITHIIDQLSANNYTHLELVVGNDGFRFLLDDLSLDVNGNTYTSNQVSTAIHAGNVHYDNQTYGGKTQVYNPGAKEELNQNDMDTIFAYAKSKNIQIIPLINTPGHMNAICEAMTTLGINNPRLTISRTTSKTTIDLTNQEAVNFTLALTNKYIQYFASKGCTIFNMGADEYGEDAFGGTCFARAQDAGYYDEYIQYVNNMAALVQNAGMAPMAFNDGFYYNNNKSFGTFDTNIIIAYWSSGGSNRSAANLANDGFKILNTHSNWYYVLGRQSGSFIYSDSSNFASSVKVDDVQGSTTTPIGSMACLWCDNPQADYSTNEVNRVSTIISTQSTSNPTYFTTVPDNYKTLVFVERITNVINLDIGETTSFNFDGNVTDQVDHSELDSEIASVTTTVNTHPSYTTNPTITKNNNLVNGEWLIGNGTQWMTMTNGTLGMTTNPNDATKFTVNNGTISANGNYVNVKVTQEERYEAETKNLSNFGNGSGYYYWDGNNYYEVKITNNGKNGNNIEYYVSYNNGTPKTYKGNKNEITLYTKNTNNSYSLETSTTSSTWQVNNGSLVSNGQYLTYTNGWNVGSNANVGSYNYIPGQVVPESYTTNVTVQGLTPGTTMVTINGVDYQINVRKGQKEVTLLVGDSITYKDAKASTVQVADSNVASISVSGNNLTITGLAPGTTTVETTNCTYVVRVVSEDVSNVTPLTVRYWVTNNPVTVDGNTQGTIKAADVHSLSGVEIASLIPHEGVSAENQMLYWKSTIHTYGNWQLNHATGETNAGGSTVDKSDVPTTFKYIRYYNSKWSYSVDGNEWVDINMNATRPDRLDIYYMQVTTITDEVTTTLKDWGEPYGNFYNEGNFALLDFAVRYESGDIFPSGFPVNSKTQKYHCNNTDKNVVFQANNTDYRRLGVIVPIESEDYEVYMITLTPTADLPTTQLQGGANGQAVNQTNFYRGTEKVVWVDDEANLGDFADPSKHYTSPSGLYNYTVGGDPVINGVEIYNKQGMLVTYYVRAKVTEDSLTVQYVNQTTNEEFYRYNIAVKAGTVFNQNIQLVEQNVVNGAVLNNLDKTQTVSSNLGTMPNINAAYRYSDYTVTNLIRSDDGKVVTIYYTFTNEHSFIVDFGLPVIIKASDLGISGDWSNATVTQGKYGSTEVEVGKGITYKPTEVLTGVDTFKLTLTDDNGETATSTINIIPATTVYYEEDFATLTGFTGGSKGNGTQATSPASTQLAVKPALYGFDDKYANENAGPSNGTQAGSITKGDNAVINFTGTGIEVFANTTTETQKLTIVIRDKDEKAVKVAIVNTAMVKGQSLATDYQEVNGFNEPVYYYNGLPYGNYTATITNSLGGQVYLDGFRVYGTIAVDNSAYVNDLEDNPTYIELRNEVLSAYNVDSTEKKEQVYGGDDPTVSIISNTADYSAETVQDLLVNGPKNELYLQPGQAVTFNVNTNRKVEVGMHSLNTKTKATINGIDQGSISTTDMFYLATSGDVIIKNTGSGILAITKIKVCDEVVLSPLTEADIDAAIEALNAPVVQYADATLNITVNGKTTTLTLNGEVGKTSTFTASEIQKVAMALVPSGYELKVTFSDVEVENGEEKSISYTATQVVTKPGKGNNKKKK